MIAPFIDLAIYSTEWRGSRLNVSDCLSSNVALSSLGCLVQRRFCGSAPAIGDAVTVLGLMNGCEVSVHVPMRALHQVDDVRSRCADVHSVSESSALWTFQVSQCPEQLLSAAHGGLAVR